MAFGKRALDCRPESASQLSELAQRSLFAGNKLLVQLLMLLENKICNTLPC